MTPIALLRPFALTVAVVAAGLGGGCNSLEGLMPSAANSQAAASSVTTSPRAPTSSNPGSMNRGPMGPQDAIVRMPLSSEDLECPVVEIADGGAFLRSGGAENGSVRYQFNINNVARQCSPAGPTQASIKIGVNGDLLLGPAGAPGAYSAPIRVTIRRASDQKPVLDKAYRVEARADQVQHGAFELVTEPLMVPMTDTDLSGTYEISVGFGGGGAALQPRKRRVH